MVSWLVTFWISCAFAVEVGDSVQAGHEAKKVQVDTTPAANEVTALLKCIQANAPEDLFFNPDRNYANCAIETLGRHIQQSADRHGMNNTELVLFLSQVAAETHLLTNLVETTKLKTAGCAGAGPETDPTQTASIKISGKGLATQKYAGDHVGVGLLQLTGIDNKFSAIDYIRQMTDINRDVDPETGRAKAPKWRAYWEYEVAHPQKKGKLISKKLLPNASEQDVREFLGWYQRKYGKGSLNVYGVLQNPKALHTAGMDLTDPARGYTSSTTIICETSMAYWEGACGGEMKLLANGKTPPNSRFSPDNFTDPADRMVKAATQCVKRNRDINPAQYAKDVQLRRRWFDVAAGCAPTTMIRGELLHRGPLPIQPVPVRDIRLPETPTQ